MRGKEKSEVMRLDVLEVEWDILVLSLSDFVRHIDLRRVRQLSLRLESSRLVRRVLEDDVGLRVLVVAQTNQNDVACKQQREERQR